MVQQQLFGAAGHQLQAPTNTNNTSLAMPAIIATATPQQPQQQASQYSPQFYQQQIAKSQQQFINQQQQQPVARQLNGLHHQTPTSVNQMQHQQYSNANQQQDSPPNQMLITESLYNGGLQQSNLSRPAPIYAPKPTYYGQANTQQQQAQAAPLYQPQAPSRPIAQQQASYFQGQQQASPAGLSAQAPQQQQQRAMNGPIQQTPLGLSVRQLPMSNGLIQAQPANLSPMQQQQVNEQRQQQQQMQHLIMSYQQQQQQQQQLNASLQSNELMQQQQAAYMQSTNPQHVDVRWSQLEEQQRQLQQQQQLMAAQALSERVVRGQQAAPQVSTLQRAISDRDSISTVSRFNQFDERRSITMRSQYTNARNDANRMNSRQFSFMKLTGEAIKRLIGLSGDSSSSSRMLIDKHQQHIQRNLSLSASVMNGNSGNKNNTNQPFTSPPIPGQASAAKVTVIDSAEDYYFKRQVFKYQLVILRLINLLSTLFVLLSPVAMLLIPKMESLFNASHAHDFSSSDSALQDSGAAKANSPVAPSVTHAVGLTGAVRHQVGQHLPGSQQAYFMPQPQWKISECTSDCDGPLIGFVARFIMLCVACWAIFFRAQTATLPRIDFYRCLITLMAILLTLAYWLFFIFRVFDKRFNDFELQYMTIIQFALSMLESLILLHYLAVVLLELRQRKKVYCLKVVRSPDGASQYYSCGSLSIQKCAQFVLEKYHRDFKQYGAYAEQLLALEDEFAKNLENSRQQRIGNEFSGGGAVDKSPRTSRPSSPASSLGGRSSRRTSRHHHRSPSPVRSTRSRSHRRTEGGDQKSNSRGSQVKLYQVDLNPPEQNNGAINNNNEEQGVENKSFNGGHQETPADESQQQQQENDSNSADQSSDATSRMKESSLETIKAANSTSDLLSQTQQKASATKTLATNPKNRNNSEQQQQSISTARDETESVRSVRSRRSTSRSHHKNRSDHRERERERERDHHHHHHHHHNNRERSSSRGAHADHHGAAQEHHHNAVSLMVGNSNRSVEDPLEDHEKKLRRRKFRLLVAVQDTFDQIKQADEETQRQPLPGVDASALSLHQQQEALSASQAARSLYPSIARSLQKYLRLTKQTGRHNLQSIYEHLSKCLLYKLSARCFLEKFLNQDPVWQQNETNLFAQCRLEDYTLMSRAPRNNGQLEINSWSLVCDTLLSRQIDSGTFFVLKQSQVSLLVTVAKLPHLNLSEEVIDQKSCKFTLSNHQNSQLAALV